MTFEMAFALLEKTIYALYYHRQEEGVFIHSSAPLMELLSRAETFCKTLLIF